MLREIRDLGFEYAELSHGIRISLLPGIIEAVDAGEIRISTLHNFCPLPIGVNHANPNLFGFSSLDARERENAWRYSIKTIETAQRLKARLVVLHMGCIDMKDYTDKLIEMVGAGLNQTPKYEKLCAEVIDKREQKKERHVQLGGEMLARLVEEADVRGIQLGIENREALEELPLESDFTLFFREFPSPTVCYWHDTGHAQIKANLGFIHHAMHLGQRTEVHGMMNEPQVHSSCHAPRFADRAPRRISHPRCSVPGTRPLSARLRHDRFCGAQGLCEDRPHQGV